MVTMAHELGFEVVVEHDAGAGASLNDAAYAAAGAAVADAAWVEPEWLAIRRIRLGTGSIWQRFVHLTDIHYRGDQAYLQRVVNEVNRLSPDFVFFTGDLVELASHVGLFVLPSLVLIVVAVWGYMVLDRNEAVAADRLNIDVYAQQFNWTYGYPDAGIETGTLVLPVNRQAQLNVRARDVIHDFWVPEFGIKGDAVPGIDHVLWINPTKEGTYPVVCAELCGWGHYKMRGRLTIESREKFDAWLAQKYGEQHQAAFTPTPAESE